MRRASENIGAVVLVFFILILSSLAAQAETIDELFQNVAYIQGKGDVERAPVDGVEY